MSEIQILQKISDNTSPRQTSMISISSKNPEFSIRFPSPISVYKIALAKLRLYNSWPNIRNKRFGNQQPNNSLVFAYKNRPDGTPDWNVVGVPQGSYQIEALAEELNRKIKSIVGDPDVPKSDDKKIEEIPKINIIPHEPTL